LNFASTSIEPIYDKLREGAALNNIHFLENDSVVIDGVRFLGTTLWTDYRLRFNRTAYSGDRDQSFRSIVTGCAASKSCAAQIVF